VAGDSEVRWKASPPHYKGDWRTVTKFAWLPIKTQGGIVVWLENYVSSQQYKETVDYFGFPFLCWQEVAANLLGGEDAQSTQEKEQ